MTAATTGHHTTQRQRRHAGAAPARRAVERRDGARCGTRRRAHEVAPRRHAARRAGRRTDPRRPSEAVFRRRRAVVGIIFAVLVAVGVVTTHDVLAGSGGDPASAAASQPALVRTVVAQPGDSLWSIAAIHRGEISITRYVDTLVDLNGGASIAAGQTVVLP